MVGVPDEKYGEELCAWIRMRDGAAPLDADAVCAFATGKLALQARPCSQEPPMTAPRRALIVIGAQQDYYRPAGSGNFGASTPVPHVIRCGHGFAAIATTLPTHNLGHFRR